MSQQPLRRSASLFRNGRNQALRLPREMEFDADAVLIERHGDALLIRAQPRSWQRYLATAPLLDPDFPVDIHDVPAEEPNGELGW